MMRRGTSDAHQHRRPGGGSRPQPSTERPSLTSILQRIAAGQHDAVVECVDAYGGLIWRMARRYLDHAPSEVDDAVQEVFITLWMNADRFDPARGSEAAFIAAIARNRLTDHQRRLTTRRRHLKKIADNSTPECTANAHNIHGDSTEEVSREFNQLPDDERNALWLAVHQGMTHQQISEITSAPLGTVKSRLRRAMIRLCEAGAHLSGRVGVKS